jgi:hypothetical protein
VVATGWAVFVEAPEEKRFALETIMAHYSNERFQIPASELDRVLILKVELESVSGKQSE